MEGGREERGRREEPRGFATSREPPVDQRLAEAHVSAHIPAPSAAVPRRFRGVQMPSRAFGLHAGVWIRAPSRAFGPDALTGAP